MSKQAVQIDLVHLAEKRETLRIVAILKDGRFHLSEMYGHVRDWTENGLEIFPFILTDEGTDRMKYVAEWGYGDKSHVTINFAPRPLEIGQEVIRTDIVDGKTETYAYQIVDITSLLD
ncbi:hypothetical protein [Pseudomonas paracarnis]|uniref:hypothetical protein n=1 Tax=Pseudomonas paracarnis TaxID=2750625 RepID=UPI002FDF6A10